MVGQVPIFSRPALKILESDSHMSLSTAANAASGPERKAMIDKQIVARGVRSATVLQAMDATPREWFVADNQKNDAYCDSPLSIGEGQTISQPYIVALMTELLELQPHHRVLEIGTGSGYQTAILARLAAAVFTIERIEALSHRAQERLSSHGIGNVQFRVGDGTLGWPEAAPFDRILVTAGSPTIPHPLYEQLSECGRMVLPVGPDCDQTLRVVERRSGHFIEHPGIPVRFVRLIGKHGFDGS